MATQHGRFSPCAGAELSGFSLPSDTVLLWLLLCFCFCTFWKISAKQKRVRGGGKKGADWCPGGGGQTPLKDPLKGRML